ncbi:Tetratricopeptide TPR_1 repeat-containing protein [[Leptolyngbya] sp. PCC 7376]|uniref:tetratricopeptide repeat protein n=1 Tax=[Leptolyngbya] sp. PCC 7376 TaxID=111781 RepID=UPI00029ED49C|nr:tetratricopeptide repeat protein [[Leptolyngbya] sp. PCC 7376]AFY39719.1 Tetratricopeptide TPR_1 repeat-containing protein [[Leptolyngbya] sp. PCC 7376]
MAGLLKKLFSADKSTAKKQLLVEDNLPALTDADFEFLLDQLLQGLAHGWQPDRVEVFMLDLGSRGKASAWEAWLKDFSARILAQSQRTQQRQIGTRLIYISDALNSSPKLQRLSKVFTKYGQQLVTGKKEGTLDLIWEYDGPDAIAETTTQAEPVADAQPAAPTVTATATSAPTPQPPQTETVIQSSPEPLANDTTIQQDIQQPAEPAPPTPSTTPVEPQPAAAQSEPVSPQNQNLQELFNRGLAKADQGDFTGAIADWDEVLKMNDRIPQVWHNRGSAFGCIGQFQSALECFDKAIAILPEGVVAWKDRSYALMKLERWQDALESWNHTIDLRDNVAEAWFQRGCTLERLEKFDNAQINYRKAIALEPDFAQAKQRLELLQSGQVITPNSDSDPWSEA